MANPIINISSLDFDGIKNSLKQYLNTKPEFTGYDFDGSAINLLLDILAYNTMFYGFYTNMIANETFLDTAKIESNVLRFANILGINVSDKKCAKATIEVKSANNVRGDVFIYPYLTPFETFDRNGNRIKFYTIGHNKTKITGFKDFYTFTVYQANTAVNRLPVSIDFYKQTALLDKALDPDTLIVKDRAGFAWSRYDGTNSTVKSNYVYFLEKNPDGFKISFGRQNGNDFSTQAGRITTEGVYVSYLISSGSIGNNLSPTLAPTGTSVKVVTPSSGGTDNINLDNVKAIAPKVFAANNRVVTKDDYYGVLLSSSVLPTNITKQSQINIWGGDTSTPPLYGKTYFSFANTGLTSGTASVIKCVDLLKGKAILGTVPTYVKAQPIYAYLNLNVEWYSDVNPNQSIFAQEINYVNTIESEIESYYNSTPTFNNNITTTTTKNIPTGKDYIKSFTTTSAYLVLGVCGSDGQKLINFKNELKTGDPFAYGSALTTTGFTYNSKTIYLADKPTVFDSFGYSTEGVLVGVTADLTLFNNLNNLGYINYKEGYALIFENILSNNSSIDVTAYVNDPDNIIIKDEYLVTVDANVAQTITDTTKS